MWEQTEDICLKCSSLIESYVAKFNDIEYDFAERCTSCKWQINFYPKSHKVKYGKKVEIKRP